MKARWHHSSLAVYDLKKSARFYQAMFGFETLFEARLTKEIVSMTQEKGLLCDLMQLGRDGDNTVLELIAFQGLPSKQLDKPIHPGTAHLSFIVDNLDEAISTLRHLKGKVLGDIVHFSEGKSVYCQEPGGSFIELEELKES